MKVKCVFLMKFSRGNDLNETNYIKEKRRI